LLLEVSCFFFVLVFCFKEQICDIYIHTHSIYTIKCSLHPNFKTIHLVGGGVQLGPLGMAATDWAIVPALGDYGDEEFGGMKIGRGN
jgi:hypothetical protein